MNSLYLFANHLLLNRNSDGLQETCDTVAVAAELSELSKMSLTNIHILFSTVLDKLDRCLDEKSMFCEMGTIVVRFTFTGKLSVNILTM